MLDEWLPFPIRGSPAAVSDSSPSMSYSPNKAAASPKRDRARVLVMDDDPAFRNLLSACLRTKYLISVASDGRAGLQKMKEYPPDIAIIDVQMPELDGLQTLTAMRKDPTLSDVWVIMLTADASRETVLAAVQSGADDYLIKTAFSKAELVRKIERLLLRERSGSKPAMVAGAPMAGVPGPHHVSPSRSMVIAGEIGDCDSGEIPTGSLPSDSITDRSSTDPTHLQEILDSWD